VCEGVVAVAGSIHLDPWVTNWLAMRTAISCPDLYTATAAVAVSALRQVTLGVLILCGIMTNYTGHILLRCLYVDPRGRLNNYPAIGQAAYGNAGRYIVCRKTAFAPPITLHPSFLGPDRTIHLPSVRARIVAHFLHSLSHYRGPD